MLILAYVIFCWLMNSLKILLLHFFDFRAQRWPFLHYCQTFAQVCSTNETKKSNKFAGVGTAEICVTLIRFILSRWNCEEFSEVWSVRWNNERPKQVHQPCALDTKLPSDRASAHQQLHALRIGVVLEARSNDSEIFSAIFSGNDIQMGSNQYNLIQPLLF